MKKIFLTFDKTIKAQNIKKKFFNKIKTSSIKKCDLIIVGGGDGYMLHCIRKYYKYNKPFYGVNCGTIGFLMNKIKKNNIFYFDNDVKKIFIKLLDINVKTKKKTFNMMAINEVSLLRQSKQTTKLKIKINKKNYINKLIGDGVLVSTPAGSTAYNFSVNGPIISLNSNKLTVTPISPFRPRKLRGKIISDKSLVSIINLDPKKRPVSCVADNVEVRNIINVRIRIRKKKMICLLYQKNKSLDDRIKTELLRNYKNIA